MTEAGTQKRLAVWIVRDPAEVERIATLGPDALALGRDEFADLLSKTGARIKTVLTDQRTLAGIGNAYSDEILHTAKLVAVRDVEDTVSRSDRHPVRDDPRGARRCDRATRGAGGGPAQGREAVRAPGTCPDRVAVPGLR